MKKKNEIDEEEYENYYDELVEADEVENLRDRIGVKRRFLRQGFPIALIFTIISVGVAIYALYLRSNENKKWFYYLIPLIVSIVIMSAFVVNKFILTYSIKKFNKLSGEREENDLT